MCSCAALSSSENEQACKCSTATNELSDEMDGSVYDRGVKSISKWLYLLKMIVYSLRSRLLHWTLMYVSDCSCIAVLLLGDIFFVISKIGGKLY